MPFSLLPKMMLPHLTDLEPAALQDRGINFLMLDFDNTIVPYTTNEPTEKMKAWIETMRASQIQLCVVSNSKKERVQVFCKQYDIPCITHARKPFSDGIIRCLQTYRLRPEQCALVGDQIYTDVLGANCTGVCSILIRAIHNHNIWLKLRHVAEMPFILIGKRRLHHE